jgi:ABC-type antimicrobial peptide transport system permease subunit
VLRYLIYPVVGVLLGGVLGIGLPLALYMVFSLKPGGDGGVGTVFALLWLITIPGGVIIGGVAGLIAAWDVNRRNPDPEKDEFDELLQKYDRDTSRTEN